MASAALTNYSRRLLLSVWAQLPTALTFAPNGQIKLTLIICLFLHFCSNYSSSARMMKYQHVVRSRC